MKVTYICDICGDKIDDVYYDNLDEKELGLDSLTQEEKEGIINYTRTQGLVVYALCDKCAAELGVDRSELDFLTRPELH